MRGAGLRSSAIRGSVAEVRRETGDPNQERQERMLTMTPAATTVVRTLVTQNSEQDEAGLRIVSGGPAGEDFGVAITDSPEATDAVVETEGARVFLDEDAVLVLEDKVLDAQVDDAGGVQFAIAQQA